MTEIAKVIAGIIENIPSNTNENDYTVDGLKYCGVCHTKKQRRVNIFGEDIVPCMCKCEREKWEAEKAESDKQEQFREVMKLRKIGFPDKSLERCTFANDDGAPLMQAMKNYAEQFDTFRKDGKGLLLFGTCGTGKTFMAACIANALIDKGIPCLVTNFSRIADDLLSTFEKQEYYANLNRFPLLVIDDLNTERGTDYMKEIVYNVIDARYRAKLPVIITTNLTRQELLNTADITYQRIFSRIFEMCTPIEISGKDRRKQNLKENINDMRKQLGLE